MILTSYLYPRHQSRTVLEAKWRQLKVCVCVCVTRDSNVRRQEEEEEEFFVLGVLVEQQRMPGDQKATLAAAFVAAL